MEEERQKLSLETINDGALIEQFNIALGKVCANVADINTTTAPREIQLTVKITPNDDRTFLELVGGVKTKTAGQQAIKTTADLSIDGHGRPVALNRRRKQMDLPFNVTRLNSGDGPKGGEA